jgi:hypothetical protein
MVGQAIEIPVSTADSDGDSISLTLERDSDFVTLTDNGDGTGVLRLAPTAPDVQPCPYSIRIIATDTGNPALADAVSLHVKILTQDAFLPVLMR